MQQKRVQIVRGGGRVQTVVGGGVFVYVCLRSVCVYIYVFVCLLINLKCKNTFL